MGPALADAMTTLDVINTAIAYFLIALIVFVCDEGVHLFF